MAEETQQERTEQASAKRRQEFREKGQVAQSREVNTAAMLSVSLLLWSFYGPLFWNRLSELIAGCWRICGEFKLTADSLLLLASFIVKQMALLLAPPLLLALAAGFLASFLQIGWVFTTEPLIPDLSKLDPIKGAARFFSRRAVVEVVKSLCKVGLVGYVAYLTVAGEFNESLHLVEMDLLETISYTARVAARVLLKSCGILIALSLLDYLFVRWEMEEKMKMTRQELREEYKDTEGDPLIKSRIRSIQQQMARKRMMAEVPKADVVVTNPTHISVALVYRRGEMEAPQVVAKGMDHLALRIRELARESGVPLVENVPVAHALHKVKIGATIPEALFKAVAEILAYVYSLKGKKR